jgi:tetratricopeptide (TPR) repeat protein
MIRCLALGGLIAALCGFASPCAADRLHLVSGGVIDAQNWWVEDDWLYYNGDSGTVGLPRAIVERIEAGDSTAPAAKTGKPTAAPRSLSREAIAELRGKLETATDALEDGDYETAAAHFREVLDAQPDLQVARVGYSLSALALGKDGQALTVVLDGLARDGDHPELNELLGDLRYREERVAEALRVWKRTFELSSSDRVRDKILKAERELLAGRDLDFASTPHFNVRYNGDMDYTLAKSVMDYLESQYMELADDYRHAPPQPITVQLYPTQAFRDVTQTPEWVGGLYDGKIRVPLGGLARLDPAARSVLRHELTHAVVHSKTRGRTPRWLHEGLAQLSEGRVLNDADRQAVSALVTSGKAESWESRGFSYPAALSLTKFLVERRGFDTLVWLLDQLGEGQELDPLLERVYGYDYPGLCRVWSESLNNEGS